MTLGTDTPVTLTEFMDSRYRDYAKYVLYSRAIPSAIDGLKPSQRKVLWTAIKVARNSKMKTAALAGNVTAMANYHHGSTEGVASLMAAAWNNNEPLLKGDGNFGSRLVTEHAAPRYTFVTLSKAYDKYFADNDILEPTEDLEDPEPRFYLPLVPWALVNGISGIAIGFATDILPRDPKLLAKVCKDLVTGKVSEAEVLAMDLPPTYPNFTGRVYRRPDGPWACVGTYEIKSRTQVMITELPIGVDREKYVEFLDKLEESGKIVSYEDQTTDGVFRFLLRFPNSFNASEVSQDEMTRMLRLERATSENITTIDERGSLKIFKTASELLVHFVKYRLSRYPVRFAAWEKRDSEERDRLAWKLKFIERVVSGDIKFEGMNRSQLTELLVAEGFPETRIPELLNVRTFEFCEDSIVELRAEISKLEIDIKTWQMAKPSEWYARELGAI